ncbi:MAG: hypothetical protein ACYC6L_06045 [Anaerolineae bacterium]
MSAPIIYISHSRVKPGKLEALKRYNIAGMETLEVTKPGTLLQFSYLDEAESELSIVHIFAGAEALKEHMKGAGERLAVFSQLAELYAAELYGQTGPEIQELMRRLLEAGVALQYFKGPVGGFIRLQLLEKAA